MRFKTILAAMALMVTAMLSGCASETKPLTTTTETKQDDMAALRAQAKEMEDVAKGVTFAPTTTPAAASAPVASAK